MSIYAVGLVTVTDRQAYDRYQQAFMPVLRRFGGRLLAADEDARVVEGEWPDCKLVLLEFEDQAAYRLWSESEEYRTLAQDRRAGARATIVVARGIKAA